jgi:hypothetical protein
MMDYYSQFDMPDRHDRKKLLKEFAEQLIEQNSIIVGKKELDEMIESVVYETSNFSMTGYFIFGIKGERERLLAKLKLTT